MPVWRRKEEDPVAASAVANHLADTTDAHDASAVSVATGTDGLSQADVQAALQAAATRSQTLENSDTAQNQAIATNANAIDDEVTARGNADDLLIPLTQKGAANGVAESVTCPGRWADDRGRCVVVGS